MFGVDPYKKQGPYAALRNDAAMNQSPIATTGSPTADMMQQGGADLSQYSGAPSMPASDQFSAAPTQSTGEFMSDNSGGFDIQGMLAAFAPTEAEAAAGQSNAMMKTSPLQRGSGGTVQALPEYKRPTPASTGAEAIKQASMMYARQQPQMQQGQAQPTLIQKMLFGM